MNRVELNKINNEIASTGRTVTLCAVTKTFGQTAIQEAIAANIKHLAENYYQEALTKYSPGWWPYYKAQHQLTLHFIGHLQRNKAAKVALFFDSIDSVDRISLAWAISQARQGLDPISILLQYNPLQEEQKSGIKTLQQLTQLAIDCSTLQNINLQGLMVVCPLGQAEPAYRLGQQAFNTLNNLLEKKLTILSMGMSDDYPLALQHGSTMIRIGRALFGSRSD